MLNIITKEVLIEDYSKYEDFTKIEEYKIGIIYINGNEYRNIKR